MDDYDNDYDGSGDTGGYECGDGDGMDQDEYGIIPDQVGTNPAYGGDFGIDPTVTMLPDSGMEYSHASSSSYGGEQNGVAPQ
ncbi:hypothetical protein PG984_013962 [Apiospora sp. TS-2023a]